MAIYEANGVPTKEKIEKYNDSKDYFYRFQFKNWEIGEKSWGMIYTTEEEAQEDGCEILNGKSACNTSEELMNFVQYFDEGFRVVILYGDSVGTGHDGEEVVDVCRIEEIWDFNDFVKCVND